MIKEIRTEIPELDRVAQEYAHLDSCPMYPFATTDQLPLHALINIAVWPNNRVSN